jgi:hypothetical protein
MQKKQEGRIATRRMARELTAEEMKSLKGGGLTWVTHTDGAEPVHDGVYN